MEVTNALSNRAKRANLEFGKDSALVAVQHLLWQTVDLVRAMAVTGLRLQNVFALGKVYSNNDLIIRTLREMGATVISSTVPAPGEFAECFERDVTHLWQVVAVALAERPEVRRILVLDDGGECITNVPAELIREYDIAGVEQTSRGMLVFEEKPPPFAVVTWARTAVKLHIGGPIFSKLVLDKLNRNFFGGKPLRGAQVGILGLGSIGRGLADLVWRKGNEIMFYDPDPDFQVPAYLHGKCTRVDSLEELMLNCNYVFGCSGRDPFKDKWPVAYRPGIQLFSASSGDQEFRPIIQNLKRRSGFKIAVNTWDITSDEGPCGPIRIAYLGYPYNFVSRSAVAVPTRIVQIETGGLLASLIQARTHLQFFEQGQHAGVHRLAPAAQRFVFAEWLATMTKRHIDVQQLYGYDSALLESALQIDWLIDNTEPKLGVGQEFGSRVEESMNGVVGSPNELKFLAQGQT
jgi:hypothetical protein